MKSCQRTEDKWEREQVKEMVSCLIQSMYPLEQFPLKVHPVDTYMSNLLHNLSGWHSNFSTFGNTLWDVLCGINGIVDDPLEEANLC